MCCDCQYTVVVFLFCCRCCVGQLSATTTPLHSATTTNGRHGDEQQQQQQQLRPVLAAFDSSLTFAAAQATDSFFSLFTFFSHFILFLLGHSKSGRASVVKVTDFTQRAWVQLLLVPI